MLSVTDLGGLPLPVVHQTALKANKPLESEHSPGTVSVVVSIGMLMGCRPAV